MNVRLLRERDIKRIIEKESSKIDDILSYRWTTLVLTEWNAS